MVIIKKYLMLMCFGGFAIFSVGCSGFNASSDGIAGGNLSTIVDDSTTDLDTPTGESTDTYESSGDGVYFTEMHSDVSALYSSVHINADFEDVVSGTDSVQRQGGYITLTFTSSSGTVSKRYFSTGGSTYDSLENNYWTTKSDGTVMWRGIFQGQTGALIMIIDKVYMYGDGAGPMDTMSGSVWFKKWQVLDSAVLPFHGCTLNSTGVWDCKNQSAPIRQCWYVSRGPYDCRFQISGDGSTVTALYNSTNDTQWVKLGRFTNLNKSQVFHESY